MNLEKATLDNTELFSLAGHIKTAKVLDVYDGDSITVAFELGEFGIVQFKVRMYGYNTPELRPSKTLENREAVIAAATHSRDMLGGEILGEIVELYCRDWDKYGRLLATVYKDGININKWMRKHGGVEYYGGSKREK